MTQTKDNHQLYEKDSQWEKNKPNIQCITVGISKKLVLTFNIFQSSCFQISNLQFTFGM